MRDFSIRRANRKDAETLAGIGAETFWDTYHTDSHLEQRFIKAHISKTFTAEVIGAELAREDTIYLIAANEREKIGYARLLHLSRRKEVSGRRPLEISRIYLRKKYWGKKLGSALLERCLREAERKNCDVIWLSVWKYNQRAIKFYEKSDFKIVGQHIFDLAGSPQTDYIMERCLKDRNARPRDGQSLAK